MKIAILGFAEQGQSAYDYWNRDGNELTICDRDESVSVPSDASKQLGEEYLHGLNRFDLLVRTPALHPNDITAANPETPDILERVTTVTNEFFKVCPTKNIIGVTGTKGKGTTSTLIAKILEAANKRVHLGGNIGIPPLDLLKNKINPDDWVVLELANFQLIDLNYSPHIGVCLMVVPEHMNWHKDFEEYMLAKQQLFSHQKPDDRAVFNRNNAHSAEIVGISLARKISYEVPGPGALPSSHEGAYVENGTIYMNRTPVCPIADVALLGRHNLENVCAAIAATWEIISHDTEVIKQVVNNFAGLEYRLQFVRELDGVRYYNDSFGTTPETAIVAIQAFDAPKIVILGGSDKGSDYTELAQTVATHNVKTVVLIGEMAPKIEAALRAAGFEATLEGGDSMKSATERARSAAAPGDVVLLSPGCASFGMFKDYKDRGQQFNQVVAALA